MTKEITRWEEKYRPSTLQGYVGNEVFKRQAQKWIDENDPPHLLLAGTPGTGKTTLAKVMSKNLNCATMYINASDENNVDTIREKVKRFASTIQREPLKIIILDEADYLSPQAQAALRGLMEQFVSTTRFILTCNYVDKIIPAVQSRCTGYDVKPPSMKDVAVRAVDILTAEGVTFDMKDMALVVKDNYPDIRGVIKTLQELIVDGELEVNTQQVTASNWQLQALDALKSLNMDGNAAKAFADIRQILANSSTRDFSGLYRLLFDDLDDYAEGHKAFIIEIIAEAQYRDAFVVDKEINTMDMFQKMITELTTN